MRLALLFLFIVGLNFSQAQTGPGGVNLSSNSVWLSADYGVTVDASNGVVEWKNRMGIANLDMIGIGANKPTYETSAINGLPTISFNDDLLESSGYLSTDYFPSVNAATIIIVSKADVLNQNSTLYGTYPLATNRFSGHLPWNSRYYFDFGTCCGGGQRLTDTFANVSAVAGTYYIWGATFTSSGRTAYLDNSAVKTTTLTGTFTGHAIKKFQLGGEGEDPYGQAGDIAEFILFSSDLNEAQRVIVNNYLSAKYNLAISADYYSDATYSFDVIGIGTDDGTNKHSASGNSSSGLGLEESNTSLNATTEYLFAGHDNTANAVSTANLGAGVVERWLKDWRIEKTGTIDAKLSFDFSEGINGLYPQNSDDYLLLRLNAGTYEDVGISNINKSISGDKIIFDVSNTDLTNGYYTLGTADQSASPVFGKSLRTWYSYQSGNWNDPNTWTLDGGVTPIYDNALSEIPSSGEVVHITSGRKVTIQGTTNNIDITEIDVAGELDLTTSTGHSFNKITGNGVIITSSTVDNFPSGDVTEFADASIGGTFRIDGSNITLATDREFNNMEIILGNAADIVTMVGDYTINGTMTITSGVLQINDNSNTAQVNLNLEDLLVEANGKITVGTASTIGTFSIPGNLPTVGNYHAIYHRVNIHGNFTNNGEVRFTNQAVPDYSQYYSGGAASVYFKGDDGKSATLNGITDFYNIIIDKGSDKSYVFEINSSSTNNFGLYGPNYASWNTTSPYTSENPEVRKALWIKNGTLKLSGNLNIPTLTEGPSLANSDYLIPQNGALWIAGAGVTVRGTAITTDTDVIGHVGVDNTASWNAFDILGRFRISDGALDVGNASDGFAYWSTSFAEVIIEGGMVTAPWFNNVGSGNSSYSQSGGIFYLTGQNSNGDFNLNNTDAIFSMTGGEIILDEGDLLIGSAVGNYSVTGGLVTFNMSGNANINSTANLWDIELTAQSGTRTLTLQQDLIISNDLTINANTILDTDPGNNYNLTIGADVTIDAAGIYTANSNTTTLDGVKISNLNFGALVTFNDLVVNKALEYQLVEIDNGTPTAIQIDGTFSHLAGTFDYKSFDVNAKADIIISDTIGVLGQSGQVLLDGAVAQTITSNNGAVGNIELDNTNGIQLTGGALTIFERLTLTNGVFDINTEQLIIGGSSGNISGTGFGTTKMIQTDGNSSDGGLSMYVDANETITYPLGTDANADTRYTPLVAVFSSFSDDGYISVSPSDDVLATTDGTGGTMLSYYWHVQHQGFTAVPKVTSYTFSGSENDDGTGSAASFPNSWRAGKVLSENPYTRSREDNTSINNPTGHDINFDGDGTPFDVENADYSAGPSNRFNGAPGVYYSRVANGTWTDWDLNSTWSTDDVLQHEGAAATSFPGAGDIAIIGSVYTDGSIGRHQLAADVDIDVAQIIFDSKPGAHPSDVTAMSRLRVELGITVTVAKASGKGEFVPWIRNNGGTQTEGLIVGDLGDFIKEDSSGFFYWIRGTTNQRINVTDRFEFPWLRVFGGNQNAELTFSNNVTALGLVIDNTATLAVTNDYDIQGQAIFGANGQGSLLFDDNGSNDTFQCDSLYFQTPSANSNTLSVDATGTDIDVMIVEGPIDIENASTLDLSTAGSNVILELLGTGNHNFVNTSGTTIDLYQIRMNKGSDQSSTFSFDDDFTISTPTASIQPLDLQNGTLILNDATIGDANDLILTNATNNTSFNIPASAALQISAGKAVLSGTNIGITLDGLLQIDGTGELDMSGGSNNFIEYSASGNANIIVDAGTLTVGSQIRRSTVSTTGVLNYSQTGGTVIIGKESAPESARGVFEVLNAGSDMTLTGGNFTIARQNGTTPTIAALYLDPTTSDFSGSTITMGSTDTPVSQTEFNLNIVPSINNLIFAGSNTPISKLVVNPLTIAGDITINTGHTFDASGFDLSVAGNFVNNGTYSANGNITTFNGATTQDYSGSGSETFYNVVKNNSSSFTASKSITIANDLTLSNGAFNTGTNTITVQGNVEIDIDVSSTSGNGLVFQGTAEQFLSRSTAGSSTIDILTINNGLGVTISSADYSFIIDDKLRLSSGKFNVGSSLLTLSGTCDIVEVSSFSDVNMIQTNSSFSDNGVMKLFPSIASSTNFIFPVGESLYTPADFTISSMDQGNITVRPANEMHISIIEDTEAPDPEIVDADNALQYHWVIGASSITSLTGTATFTFDPSDAIVSGGGYTLANYIPAILLDATTAWDKAYSTTDFDEVANTFTISYTAVGDAGISGVYTAGVGVDGSDNPINGAIPDNIALYETNSTGGGNYDVGTTWTTAIPVGGPIGGQITVKTGDELILNNNNVRLSRTIIESGATLTVDETTQHRLGTITGTGTLKISSSTTNAIFPAGDYSDFFGCSGGGLEYAGTGSYSIMSGLTSVRNLSLTGSGSRNLANNDITICEDFLVNGPTFNNANNRNIDVTDQLIVTGGIFNSGTGAIDIIGTTTINGGTFNQEGGGSSDFISAVTISSGTFNAGTGGQVVMHNDLTFSGGTFTGGSSSASVEFKGTATQDITGSFTGGNKFYRFRMIGSGVRLNNNIEIDNQLTLDNGLIDANGNTVLLGSAITVSPSASGQANSYINGRALNTISTVGNSFTFPIGGSTQWRPAKVQNVSIGGLTWEAEYFQTSPLNEALVDNLDPTDLIQIATVSNAEYWKISDGNGTPSGATATIGLSWGLESDVSAVKSEREELQVLAWNDGVSSWDNFGGLNFSSGHTQAGGSFDALLPLGFSAVSENIATLGSSDVANPLPVELIFFNARVIDSEVELNWETATELNNDYFTLLRSKDGNNFEEIAVISGAGTSSSRIAYKFFDERPYQGFSYYKLIQTDFNGMEEELEIVAVRMDDSETLLTITSYPNPIHAEPLTISISGLNSYESSLLIITDQYGKQIFSKKVEADDQGYVDVKLTLSQAMNNGVYLINLATEKGLLHSKIVKY